MRSLSRKTKSLSREEVKQAFRKIERELMGVYGVVISDSIDLGFPVNYSFN